MHKTVAAGRLTTAASSRPSENLSGINHVALANAKRLLSEIALRAAANEAKDDNVPGLALHGHAPDGRRCDCGCDRGRANLLMTARMASR